MVFLKMLSIEGGHLILRKDDSLIKIFRVQANPDLVWCGYYNHTTDPVGGYGDFLLDSFLLQVIKFGLGISGSGSCLFSLP